MGSLRLTCSPQLNRLNSNPRVKSPLHHNYHAPVAIFSHLEDLHDAVAEAMGDNDADFGLVVAANKERPAQNILLMTRKYAKIASDASIREVAQRLYRIHEDPWRYQMLYFLLRYRDKV